MSRHDIYQIPSGVGQSPSSTLEQIVGCDEELFAYSVTAAGLFKGKNRQQKINFLSGFLQVCQSPKFINFTDRWGLMDARFDRNRHAAPGNEVFDRFFQACCGLPEMATLALVFHGTYAKNIDPISREGLDPNKRSGQAYGTGEYFATEPGLSTSYCRGDKKMLVFIVVVPLKTVGSTASAASTRECPHNMVVVPTAEHQLPLGVLTFREVSASALTRSQQAQATLQRLSVQVRTATEAAAVAKMKASIIQAIIQDGIDVAAEIYAKNKDCLCDTSKKEIAMYAHRVSDAEVVEFYMPGLPQAMSCAEHDETAIKSVGQLEDDLTNSKLELAREVKLRAM